MGHGTFIMPGHDAILTALLVALIADALIGDPAWLYRHIGHPVEWLGAVIAWADRRFNRECDAHARRRFAGTWIAVGIIVGAAIAGLALQMILLMLPGGPLWLGLVMSSLISARGLRDHVKAVERALRENDLGAARVAVARIVGRDPETLDEAGISRAAIESLAENFSDGVVAPVFWGLLFGLPGLLAYKALNTADSMIGHKNARHRDFGRASARLDDAANFLPARISGAVICGGAFLMPGARPTMGWSAMRRDARHHRSPNAGWPEAAMAGALGLALAGPRRYQGELVADHWMGTGGREAAVPEDITRAVVLFDRAWLVLAAGLAGAVWISH
jgi:adenosylcobinamide-phosphate synthase